MDLATRVELFQLFRDVPWVNWHLIFNRYLIVLLKRWYSRNMLWSVDILLVEYWYVVFRMVRDWLLSNLHKVLISRHVLSLVWGWLPVHHAIWQLFILFKIRQAPSHIWLSLPLTLLRRPLRKCCFLFVWLTRRQRGLWCSVKFLQLLLFVLTFAWLSRILVTLCYLCLSNCSLKTVGGPSLHVRYLTKNFPRFFTIFHCLVRLGGQSCFLVGIEVYWTSYLGLYQNLFFL